MTFEPPAFLVGAAVGWLLFHLVHGWPPKPRKGIPPEPPPAPPKRPGFADIPKPPEAIDCRDGRVPKRPT